MMFQIGATTASAAQRRQACGVAEDLLERMRKNIVPLLPADLRMGAQAAVRIEADQTLPLRDHLVDEQRSLPDVHQNQRVLLRVAHGRDIPINLGLRFGRAGKVGPQEREHRLGREGRRTDRLTFRAPSCILEVQSRPARRPPHSGAPACGPGLYGRRAFAWTTASHSIFPGSRTGAI